MEGDCTSQDQVLPRRNPTAKVVIVILYKVAVITNVTLVYSSMDSAHHDTINLNVSEERKEKKMEWETRSLKLMSAAARIDI